jgi:hypothetical protein
MAVKCPTCRSSNISENVNYRTCLNCGGLFNQEGPMESGPDQNTKDTITRRLENRATVVSGNLADLQRAGAAAASGGKANLGAGVALPPGYEAEGVTTPAEDDAAKAEITVESTRAGLVDDLLAAQAKANEPRENHEPDSVDPTSVSPRPATADKPEKASSSRAK